MCRIQYKVDGGQEEKGLTEDEMVGWHHQLNGHEFEQTLGDGEGQGSLACCHPWGCRVGYDLVTEQQQQYKRVVIMLVLLSTGIFDVDDKY